MQIELPQHFLGASEHPLVLILAGFRSGDGHQLDLDELVLPDHAAGVATGRTRFGAEARRQRGEAHRQFLLVDDGFTDQICERHFGGGDEP